MNRGYACVALYHPKTSYNVGGVLRAVGCFGAALVVVQGRRYRRSCVDTSKQYRHTPLVHTMDLRTCIPFDCISVAVEIVKGATPLPVFTHPQRAFYVFGPEDGSISKEVLSWCPLKVQIPSKFCLNLAACVNVVLYDRVAKDLAGGVSNDQES